MIMTTRIAVLLGAIASIVGSTGCFIGNAKRDQPSPSYLDGKTVVPRNGRSLRKSVRVAHRSITRSERINNG